MGLCCSETHNWISARSVQRPKIRHWSSQDYELNSNHIRLYSNAVSSHEFRLHGNKILTWLTVTNFRFIIEVDGDGTYPNLQ